MRSAVFTAPLMVALAYAAKGKDTTSKSYTLVPELSGSVTITSTYRYSNPATAYLTQTNSQGVVTGEPGASTEKTGQPAVTSQPPAATIPAGISGTTVITVNGTKGLTSFTVSANSKTTKVLGHPGGKTGAAGGGSSNPFSSNGAGPTGKGPKGGKPGSSPSGNANGASSSSAAASSSTGNAAPSGMKIAGAGVIGLGAVVAAML